MEILISTNMRLPGRRGAPQTGLDPGVSAWCVNWTIRRHGTLARYKGNVRVDHLTPSSLSFAFERFTHRQRCGPYTVSRGYPFWRL